MDSDHNIETSYGYVRIKHIQSLSNTYQNIRSYLQSRKSVDGVSPSVLSRNGRWNTRWVTIEGRCMCIYTSELEVKLIYRIMMRPSIQVRLIAEVLLKCYEFEEPLWVYHRTR